MTRTTSTRAQTIVLVEDENDLAIEIKSQLEGLGHLVRMASIAEAADAARVGDAALMIMDRIVFGAWDEKAGMAGSIEASASVAPVRNRLTG